jgi:predicted hydrocarbon binding protein
VLAPTRRHSEAVKPGLRPPAEEATATARLLGRRPDAEPVFREAGRALARQTYARIAGPTRRMMRLLPGLFARPLALRQIRRIAARYLGGTVKRVGATIHLEVRESVTRDTAPKLAGCTFYEAVLRELMQLLVDGAGAVEHVRCVSRNQGTCEWRAQWRAVR